MASTPQPAGEGMHPRLGITGPAARLRVPGGRAARVIDLSEPHTEGGWDVEGRRPRQYEARTYGAGQRLPARWWRQIQLHYPSGQRVTLVYLREPTDPGELPELMWELQCAAGRYGFRIWVTTADGYTTEAPAIGGQR